MFPCFFNAGAHRLVIRRPSFVRFFPLLTLRHSIKQYRVRQPEKGFLSAEAHGTHATTSFAVTIGTTFSGTTCPNVTLRAML